jgi:hypothetical protein
MKKRVQALRVLAVALFLAACAHNTQPWTELKPDGEGGPPFHLTGTVTRMEIEGGLWVIRAQDGAKYNVINLPQEFQVDGSEIEADARRREHVASIDMAGPSIDILRIRRR